MATTSSLLGDNQPSTRYSDICKEPVTRHLLPIKGYQDAPDVSLEKAIESISQFFDKIEENVWTAKENCREPKEGLTPDQSASIHLYTMQFDGGPSLYYVLNEALRAADRQKLKPWFPFLKLFLTGLYHLPSLAQTVFRGVRDVDLSSTYPNGSRFAWWGVSSCTSKMEVLDTFIGTTGIRTIFIIECRNGKLVALHSYYKDREAEIILMPGSYFEVKSQHNPAPGLYQIHLKEIDPPFTLLKPPVTKAETYIPLAQMKPSKMNNPLSMSSVPPLADSGHTSSNDELKILKCDMLQGRQDLIVPIVISDIEQGGSNNDIAGRIVRSLDKRLGSKWYCVVGDPFGSYVTYETNCFMSLKYKKFFLLLWKCDKDSVNIQSCTTSCK